MKCKDCPKYWKTQNDDKGVCSLMEYHELVSAESECLYYSPKPLQCEDCYYLYRDFACATCSPDQPADGLRCFLDKNEAIIEEALMRLFRNGRYSRELILQICERFEEAEEIMFLLERIKKQGDMHE